MAGKNEPSLENHQEQVPMRMTSMRLELLSRHRIRDPGLGLNEPSGLTLNANGSALYTVSDETKAIFRLDLKGRVSVSDSFFIGLDDLEGIALRGDDSELLVVQERSNSVVVVSVESSSISKPGWRSFTTTTWLLLVFTVMPSNPLLSGGSGKRCAIVS